MGVLVGNFENEPLKGLESLSVGTPQIHFHPEEVPILKQQTNRH